MKRIVLFLFDLVMVCSSALAEPLAARLERLKLELARQYSVPIEQWRVHEGEVAGAERPDFDDSAWPGAAPGFSWSGNNTSAWFRAQFTIPAAVTGCPVEGLPVRLSLGVASQCELYVNGQLRDFFRTNNGFYTLMERARPGQAFSVALHGFKGDRDGQFRFARLRLGALPELEQYLDEVTFLGLLAKQVPAEQQAGLKEALNASEACIQFAEVTPGNLESVRAQLVQAQARLAPVGALTKKYDVYYVGHTHIDMNWKWPWSETIDVCHRTWNSAMNLMDEFPEFCLVATQPASYVPIQTGYPAEFARIRSMVGRGQWELTGGMWNESDTILPSGEALARSFLLGQRYFKAQFGKYAVTGWLPDSFGHSGQLPQIMRLAGVRNFYHMRGGNGIELSWWEAPDGSRVLKANTPRYEAKPQLDQLVVPMANEARLGVPQSVVVFGVGDHGGGPTREQILRIRAFQRDPILPRVHFIGADSFFEQLASQPAAASLPVVDSELQYTFEGCYTTHADIKKALRHSENVLYTAETFSSLAALMGQPYPVEAFRAAWDPVAFAQFHDTACGTAIHASYDWTRQQLAPTFRFAEEQTDKSLDFLTAGADTRGAGAQAIVVWNSLSFARDDVVKVSLAGAEQYHSVVDKQGQRFPAQAMERNTLVFIARAVPAFGHAVYFPATNACASDGLVLRDGAGTWEIETPSLALRINKTTGAMARLYSKRAKWNAFGSATDANGLELLGDAGRAFSFRYTGQDKVLTTEGGRVSVVEQGPVYARVRVAHAFGQSSYTQEVVVYGALPRIDIPTTINWQEEGQALKIRLPVNATHLEANAQIPFGNMPRPTNGQECPGQKWMDVSQTVPPSGKGATPLDLSPLFNADCTTNFDGEGNAYPAELLPAAGRRRLGPDQVPFELAGARSNRPNSVVAMGQRLKLPAKPGGDTLYLLAASPKGSQGSDLGFRLADGSVEFRAFNLNDWLGGKKAHPDSAVGLRFAYERTPSGRGTSSPRMWIAQVALPKGATELVLPQDPKLHLFAATVARKEASALYGLSVLNDCKYGFDMSSNVFRLTALRASDRPDPHPDQGLQQFTYSLYPHPGGWRAAQTEEQALGLNIPLLARVTAPHPPAGRMPSLSVVNTAGKGALVVSGLKHSEDGRGFILRFYEAHGQDTQARIDFGRPLRVEETDLLEQPLARHPLTMRGNSVTLPVGHNQIITLHLLTD